MTCNLERIVQGEEQESQTLVDSFKFQSENQTRKVKFRRVALFISCTPRSTIIVKKPHHKQKRFLADKKFYEMGSIRMAYLAVGLPKCRQSRIGKHRSHAADLWRRTKSSKLEEGLSFK